MSTALVRCPNCGSASNRTNLPDEYICSHCKSRFKFVRPGDHIVTHDVRTHNCPVCGGVVEAGKGLQCVQCGRQDLCANCTGQAPEGYVCNICVKQSQEDCVICGRYAPFKCISCLNLKIPNPQRSCMEHGEAVFRLEVVQLGDKVWRLFHPYYCPTCCGWVCNRCAVPKGTLFKSYHCRSCGTKLRTDNRTQPELLAAANQARVQGKAEIET